MTQKIYEDLHIGDYKFVNDIYEIGLEDLITLGGGIQFGAAAVNQKVLRLAPCNLKIVSIQLKTQDGANATARLDIWVKTGSYPTVADTIFRNGNISAVANNGSGKARFTTDAVHGIQIGDVITIAGTTNYNGVKTITAVSDTTHFDTADSYVSSQAGTWDSCPAISGSASGTVITVFKTGKDLVSANDIIVVNVKSVTLTPSLVLIGKLRKGSI